MVIGEYKLNALGDVSLLVKSILARVALIGIGEIGWPCWLPNKGRICMIVIQLQIGF